MVLTTPSPVDIEFFYDQAKFKLAWRLCILFAFVFTVLSLIFISGRIEELITYIVCATIAFGSVIYLYKTKNYIPIYYFMVTSGTIILMYTVNVLPVTHFGDFLWMILCITMAFFGLGIKQGLVYLVINLANMVYFSLFSVNTNIAEVGLLDLPDRIGLATEITAASITIIYVMYQFLKFHNYSFQGIMTANKELTDRNAVISGQNLENKTLVKEIHHRVRNNLQIIISLLRLQKSELKSSEAKIHFTEAINRIMVMSLIHNKLYQDGELATIDLKDYLKDLAKEISSSSSLGIPIHIDVTTEIDKVGLKTIVPLGLIINELISNSIRHAFKEKQAGSINISIQDCEGDLMKLNYSDDGKWCEPSANNKSFGLELLEVISEQLDGKIERTSNDHGTSYSLELMNIDVEETV